MSQPSLTAHRPPGAVMAVMYLAVFCVNIDTTIVKVTLPTLVAALAQTPERLIAARAFAGIGAALVFPTTLSILTQVFRDRAARAKTIGLWGASTPLAVAFGPITGGALVEQFLWVSTFLVELPIAAVAIVATLGGFALPTGLLAAFVGRERTTTEPILAGAVLRPALHRRCPGTSRSRSSRCSACSCTAPPTSRCWGAARRALEWPARHDLRLPGLGRVGQPAGLHVLVRHAAGRPRGRHQRPLPDEGCCSRPSRRRLGPHQRGAGPSQSSLLGHGHGQLLQPSRWDTTARADRAAGHHRPPKLCPSRTAAQPAPPDRSRVNSVSCAGGSGTVSCTSCLVRAS